MLAHRGVSSPPGIADHARLTGFVAQAAYQYAPDAYEPPPAAYAYAPAAYVHRQLTETVDRPADVDAQAADDDPRGAEIVAPVERVRRQASDECAPGANRLARDVNAVSPDVDALPPNVIDAPR